MDKSIKCLLCNDNFSNYIKFSYHIRKKHQITSKEYYDSFMKKDKEEKCNNIECNNICKFISFQNGYSKHCSTRCSTLNKETQDKMKYKLMEKYGVEHALQSKEILNKMIEGNIIKFGVKNIQQNKQIKEKTKKTCIEKYGVEFACQSKEIRLKIKETNIKRYGFVSPMESDIIKRKSKKSCINKYGVDHHMKVIEIKEKTRNTSLERHGYKYWVGTEEHIEWMKNGGAAYCNKFIINPSKPQVELYNICQQIFPYVILNYPCLNYSIDIAVPSLNLAIEYDGSYWHSDKEYDYERQRKLEEEGWIFLRFVDKIPTIEELKSELKEKL